MRHTLITYKVKADGPASHDMLLSKLAAENRQGIRYAVYKHDDGLSFLHLVSFEGGDPGLQDFAEQIKVQCEAGPVMSSLEEVGSYGTAAPARLKKWTRYSLVYLASYLLLTGLAFLLVPQAALSLLLATRTYDDTFVRFVGAFMMALGTLVTQIIRHRLEMLYTTTIAVRLFFLVVIVSLYLDTRDPLFVCIFGVVVVGFLFTTISYVLERPGRR